MQIDLGGGHILHTSDEWRRGGCVPHWSHMEVRHAGALTGERAVSEFIVHHTGGATLGDPDPATWLRNIWDYHVNGRRYSDIAYNTAVDDDGNLWELRENAYVGGHTLANPPDGINHNRIGHGIVFLRANHGFTDAAKVAFRKAFGLVTIAAGGRQPHRLVHNDVSMTACPGGDLADWVHHGGILEASPADNTVDIHNPPPPTPATHPFPGIELKQGSSGPVVREWQQALNGHGFGPLRVDGKFGPRTDAGTRRFQSVEHLVADGVVGPLTWRAMFG